MPTTFVVRTPAYRKEGNVCKGNLSRVSLARSVTRPQATGFALQNRTNTKKDTLLRVFFSCWYARLDSNQRPLESESNALSI